MIKSTLLLSAIVLVGMKYELDQNIKFTYPALRALVLLLADGAPPVGRGKTF